MKRLLLLALALAVLLALAAARPVAARTYEVLLVRRCPAPITRRR